MALIISSELSAILLSEAQKAHPAECCGLLIGQGDKLTRIVPAANISETPHTHFEIDPAVLIAAEKAVRAGQGSGEAVLGYYHSHPNGKTEPSQTDAAMAAPDGRYWVIIAAGQLAAFKTSENGALWERFDAVEVLPEQ
jgi:desampylase